MNCAKHTVLLVERGHEHGTGRLAIPLARCLQRAGRYAVHCLTATPRHELRTSSHVRVHIADLATDDDLVEAIRAVHTANPVDVVIPVDESDIAAVAAVADRLREFTTPAPIPRADLVAAAVDKWATHELLTAAGVPAPDTMRPTGDRQDDLAVLEGWDTRRFVVKPVNGWGGTGITVHDSAGAALDTWAAARSDDDEFIIQSFVAGSDRDVSFLAHRGTVVASTVQEPIAAQTTQFRSALGLRFLHDARAGEIVRRFASFTGWDGVAHIDMRIDERTGEPKVIEVNPRYWQTLLGSFAMGVNFPDLHCRLTRREPACGQRPREGIWYDTHAISADLGNLRGIRRGDVGAVTETFRGEFAADPRLEASLVWLTLRDRATTRLRAVTALWRSRGDHPTAHVAPR